MSIKSRRNFILFSWVFVPHLYNCIFKQSSQTAHLHVSHDNCFHSVQIRSLKPFVFISNLGCQHGILIFYGVLLTNADCCHKKTFELKLITIITTHPSQCLRNCYQCSLYFCFELICWNFTHQVDNIQIELAGSPLLNRIRF